MVRNTGHPVAVRPPELVTPNLIKFSGKLSICLQASECGKLFTNQTYNWTPSINITEQ